MGRFTIRRDTGQRYLRAGTHQPVSELNTSLDGVVYPGLSDELTAGLAARDNGESRGAMAGRAFLAGAGALSLAVGFGTVVDMTVDATHLILHPLAQAAWGGGGAGVLATRKIEGKSHSKRNDRLNILHAMLEEAPAQGTAARAEHDGVELLIARAKSGHKHLQGTEGALKAAAWTSSVATGALTVGLPPIALATGAVTLATKAGLYALQNSEPAKDLKWSQKVIEGMDRSLGDGPRKIDFRDAWSRLTPQARSALTHWYGAQADAGAPALPVHKPRKDYDKLNRNPYRETKRRFQTLEALYEAYVQELGDPAVRAEAPEALTRREHSLLRELETLESERATWVDDDAARKTELDRRMKLWMRAEQQGRSPGSIEAFRTSYESFAARFGTPDGGRASLEADVSAAQQALETTRSRLTAWSRVADIQADLLGLRHVFALRADEAHAVLAKIEGRIERSMVPGRIDHVVHTRGPHAPENALTKIESAVPEGARTKRVRRRWKRFFGRPAFMGVGEALPGI